MLPRRGTISKFAHSVIDDGDDFHITQSFQPNEENSSTIGNASVMEPPTSSFNQTSPMKLQTNRKVAMGPKSGVEVVPGQQENQKGDRGEESEEKKRFKILTAIRQLGETRRFLPWRARQAPAMFLHRSSMLSVHEYQEMVEEDGGDNATQPESDTIVSIRSSRNNLGNGRSMLVRQNAEVFRRPSAAQAKWDIASSLSSSDSSGATRNLARQRSVTLDNSSCGGFSDITDSTFFRIKKMDQSMKNRFPMFIASKSAQFGDTYCIHEGLDENHGEDQISPVSNIFRRSYDFRQLETPPGTTHASPVNSDSTTLSDKSRYVLAQVLHQTRERQKTERFMDLIASPNRREAERQISDDQGHRHRIFSDSDVVIERHRRRSSEVDHDFASFLGSSYSFRDASCEDFDAQSRHRSRTSSDVFVSRRSLDTGFDKILASRLSPPSLENMSRCRRHSDSFLPELDANGEIFGHITTFSGNGFHHAYSQIERPSGTLQGDSSTSLMVESDSHIQRPNGNLQRDSSTSAIVESDHDNLGSTWTSSALRLSEIVRMQRQSKESLHNSEADLGSSEILGVGNGARSNHTRNVGDSEENNRLPLQQWPARSPSPLSAAQTIAAVLRPGQDARIHPAPIPTGRSHNQDYYWSKDSDSDTATDEAEVLWSLTMDSLDDLF